MATIKKPWGQYRDLIRTKTLVIKKIIVEPGNRLSLQSHNNRKETWFVHKGTGKAVIGISSIDLHSGTMAVILKHQKHRIINDSNEDLIIYEIQQGECKEDDIVRYEDDYGREING